jgi:hypothetical protein
MKFHAYTDKRYLHIYQQWIRVLLKKTLANSCKTKHFITVNYLMSCNLETVTRCSESEKMRVAKLQTRKILFPFFILILVIPTVFAYDNPPYCYNKNMLKQVVMSRVQVCD